MPEVIAPHDLIPMDVFCGSEPISIDLVYAQAGHPENIFGIAAYHPQARLSLHRDMARVVLKAARTLNASHGWILILKDGLRTIEAQKILIDTDIVRQNPHWLSEPRLLSGPGQGAHPRGMAIDVSVKDAYGSTVDMGTVFDAMVPESARDYHDFTKAVQDNRQRLEESFVAAGEALSLPILPLPSEWWDFRFPASHNGQFAPLSDHDLPDALKMTATGPDVEMIGFERLAKDILSSL